MKPTMKKAASLLLALFIAVCSDLVSSQGEADDSTTQGDVVPTGDVVPAGSVDVSGTSVTFTCPLAGSITWQDKEKKTIPNPNDENQITLQTYSSTNNGRYKCSNGEKHYYFYVKAKVCESCVEVEVVQVIGIIFADLLVTAGVAILVYYWAQNRKGASAMAPAARPGRQNRAPPVPNPDYEPIRTGNREVYSGLNKRT